MPFLLLQAIQALSVWSSTSLPSLVLSKQNATPFITSHSGIECIELYFPPLAYIEQTKCHSFYYKPFRHWVYWVLLHPWLILGKLYATPFITSHSGIKCIELYFPPLTYIGQTICHSFYYKPFRHWVYWVVLRFLRLYWANYMPLLLLQAIQALSVLSSTSLPWLIVAKLYANPFITSQSGIECIDVSSLILEEKWRDYSLMFLEAFPRFPFSFKNGR